MRPIHTLLLVAVLTTPALAQDAPTDAVDPNTIAMRNPTVRAAVESPRNEPADYARAIFALIDLGEPQLAEPILAELVALNLDDDAKAQLVADFGTASFLRMAREPVLGEAGQKFAAEAMEAAKTRSTDPARLDRLLKQLGSDSDRTRAAAIAELERVGMPAVALLANAMATTDDGALQNRIREALVAMESLATPAMIAMLDSRDDELRKQAAWGLGQAKARLAAPLLAGRAVLEPAGSDPGRAAHWAFKQLMDQGATTAVAERLLETQLRATLAGAPPRRPDGQGRVVLFTLSGEEPAPIATPPMPAADAGKLYAARLARHLWGLRPDSEKRRRQAMILQLEAAVLMQAVGLTPPADPQLDPEQFTSQELSAALDEALESKAYAAATALAVTLGERNDPSVLLTADGKPSPLAKALDAAHPAARMAALGAVIDLNSPTPFPGSSRVAPALLQFAAGDASRVVVVGTPNLGRSSTIAGLLAGAGLEGVPSNCGNDAIEEATDPNVELVLIDLEILRPGVRETLFRLRRQPETALTPIGLLAPPERLEEARNLAEQHTRTVAFTRPATAAGALAIADRLALAQPAGVPTAAERAQLATTARGWIKQLLVDGPSYYNLRDRREQLATALASGEIGADAIESLALVGTPESQLELLSIVGRPMAEMATREAAAAGFTKSVEKFGVLLTTDQIEAQYTRYNASESADERTQKVLASVLDAIESRRRESTVEKGDSGDEGG